MVATAAAARRVSDSSDGAFSAGPAAVRAPYLCSRYIDSAADACDLRRTCCEHIASPPIGGVARTTRRPVMKCTVHMREVHGAHEAGANDYLSVEAFVEAFMATRKPMLRKSNPSKDSPVAVRFAERQ